MICKFINNSIIFSIFVLSMLLLIGVTSGDSWAYQYGYTMHNAAKYDGGVERVLNSTPAQVYSYYDDEWDYGGYTDVSCWFDENGCGVFDDDGNYYINGNIGGYPAAGVLICIDPNLTEKYKIVYGDEMWIDVLSPGVALDNPENPTKAFVVGEDTTVFCLDLITRTELWSVNLLDDYGEGDGYFYTWGTPCIDPTTGYVMILDGNGKVTWLDPSDGSLERQVDYCDWDTYDGTTYHGTLVFDDDNNFYFSDSEDYFYKVNSTGSLVWKINNTVVFGGSRGGSLRYPSIGSDGTIYIGFGIEGHQIVAINPDGTAKWSCEDVTGWGNYAGISLDESVGNLYAYDADEVLYCINMSTGDMVWNLTGLEYWSGEFYSNVIGGDGCVYLLDSEGSGGWELVKYSLVCVYPNGTISWEYDMLGLPYEASFAYITPSFDPSGRLWMAGDGGYILVFDGLVPEPPEPLTPTPTPTICESCGTTPPMERELNAKFERSPKMGDCPLSVTFTDTSEYYLMRVAGEYEYVSQPYNRTWDFGDGTIITNGDAIVTHEYITEGKYSVTLTIDNGTTSSLLKQVNCIYVTGGIVPNPTTTFGTTALLLNNANYNITKYAELLPTAYTGLFNTDSANAWFIFWGFVFAFIFLSIFIRVEDVALIMLFALLVAGTILALIPSDFRMIGQGLLILAVASVIYVLIKGRFK